jgi:hypothetical protein
MTKWIQKMKRIIGWVTKPIDWIGALINWLKSLSKTEYELTIWFPSEDLTPKGIIVRKSVRSVYSLSKITKKTQTHIVGKDMNNMFFEIKTKNPMDYRLIRIK